MTPEEFIQLLNEATGHMLFERFIPYDKTEHLAREYEKLYKLCQYLLDPRVQKAQL